jgi:quinoprotein glucose dehydrogenase
MNHGAVGVWRGGLARPFSVLALGLAIAVGCDDAPDRLEWPVYGGASGGAKYARASQIDASNFDQLEIAWQWASLAGLLKRQLREYEEAGEPPPFRVSSSFTAHEFQCTPLMVGGKLYGVTPIGQVFALDATSGEMLWSYDPKSYRAATHTFDFQSPKHRGVAYWRDSDEERVIVTTIDAYLVALDAGTGEPVPEFGDEGRIDLLEGLRGPPALRLRDYFQSSPAAIVGDIAIVGGSVHDRPRSLHGIPGDIRGYDVRSGALRWTFHVVPTEMELGTETWEGESWRRGGASNAWGPMTVDVSRRTIFVPTSAPTNDLYGGHRLGDNLYSNSLLAIDVDSGQLRWHRQIIRHGLWDYDLAAPPVLLDLTVEGRSVAAVAQVTKHGYTFVFDRDTGEPVWPLEEHPVPPSDVPGERAASTQPVPLRPPPFESGRAVEEDLIDFTPELARRALEIFRRYRGGPLFTPPSLEGTITFPGSSGGANWHGAAADPETGILYVHSVQVAMLLQLQAGEDEDGFAYVTRSMRPLFVPKDRWAPDSLPLFKPPYSRLTAIDLNAGEILWWVANGDGPLDHPALADLDLPPLGAGAHACPLVTETLVLLGEGGGNYWPLVGQPLLRAFDKRTGRELGRVRLPGRVTGCPMSYVEGEKQFVVVPVGGRKFFSGLVALALP